MLQYLAAETPQDVLYGYGPLGVIVVALTGFAWWMIRWVIKDRDRIIDQRDGLLKAIHEEVVPAVIRNTEVLKQRQEIDKELVGVIKDSNIALEKNTQAFIGARDAYRYRRPNERPGGG